jgi:transcriptional regulator with XRE-family HTH domain
MRKTEQKGDVSMNIALTIQEKLKDLRVERGLTLAELSAQTGISSSALGKYEADDFKDISPFSLKTLAKFYGVSTDYLLGLTEQKNHPNTALDELHLSDDMIELLKSGKINNRLLCEVATHEGFKRLMADLEIYVDRIASMQIQNLNAYVDTVRLEIQKRYNPDADDRTMQTLQAAHIQEDSYFTHAIHEDMDVIAKDLREAHKKDFDIAPETNVADDLRKSIADAVSFPGSVEEKKVRVFCNQLGLDYDKLEPDEFSALMKALKKSKLLKTGISQRGRAGLYQKHGKGKRKR